MTFEDAAELAWHLQQSGLHADALRAFETERIPRVGIIVQQAEVHGLAPPCSAGTCCRLRAVLWRLPACHATPSADVGTCTLLSRGHRHRGACGCGGL